MSTFVYRGEFNSNVESSAGAPYPIVALWMPAGSTKRATINWTQVDSIFSVFKITSVSAVPLVRGGSVNVDFTENVSAEAQVRYGWLQVGVPAPSNSTMQPMQKDCYQTNMFGGYTIVMGSASGILMYNDISGGDPVNQVFFNWSET